MTGAPPPATLRQGKPLQGSEGPRNETHQVAFPEETELWAGAAGGELCLAEPPPEPELPLPTQSPVSKPCKGSDVLSNVRRQKAEK